MIIFFLSFHSFSYSRGGIIYASLSRRWIIIILRNYFIIRNHDFLIPRHNYRGYFWGASHQKSSSRAALRNETIYYYRGHVFLFILLSVFSLSISTTHFYWGNVTTTRNYSNVHGKRTGNAGNRYEHIKGGLHSNRPKFKKHICTWFEFIKRFIRGLSCLGTTNKILYFR